MAGFTQLPSGNWRIQIRRKNRYLAETFRCRKDGEEWVFDIERNIDRSGSPIPHSSSRPAAGYLSESVCELDQ